MVSKEKKSFSKGRFLRPTTGDNNLELVSWIFFKLDGFILTADGGNNLI